MAISLHTRAFLAAAAVLAVSIGSSALLTRRATLVEVRETVSGPVIAPPLDTLGNLLAPTLERRDRLAVAAQLAAWEREHGRAALVLAPDLRTIVAASNAGLASARLRSATRDGNLSIEAAHDGGMAAIELRGARPVAIHAPDGATLGVLFAVPAAPPDAVMPASPAVPIWIVTTGGITLLAIGLAFTLSRRVLGPVRALTDAAERIERGELAARVEAPARGADEIGQLARAFNAMASRLDHDEALRRQMVSDVAHELRSPVTNLRCTLESMQDGLVAIDRASVETLYADTLLLQRLIADLQDLALAEAGRIELRLEPVDIGALARSTVSSASRRAPRIDLDIAGDLPLVRADRDRLAQVIHNLLSNAVRHTPPEGSIVVRARPDGPHVRIEVADTGVGLAADDLTRVFDRFFRADASRARATGGAGLGLAIARHLVAAHGGAISAASDGPGRGATFVVVLPIDGPARAGTRR
jgi:signal transduction histidine kinase